MSIFNFGRNGLPAKNINKKYKKWFYIIDFEFNTSCSSCMVHRNMIYVKIIKNLFLREFFCWIFLTICEKVAILADGKLKLAIICFTKYVKGWLFVFRLLLCTHLKAIWSLLWYFQVWNTQFWQLPQFSHHVLCASEQKNHEVDQNFIICISGLSLILISRTCIIFYFYLKL